MLNINIITSRDIATEEKNKQYNKDINVLLFTSRAYSNTVQYTTINYLNTYIFGGCLEGYFIISNHYH